MSSNPWLDFVKRWGKCDHCPLVQHRTRIVLSKGQLPCDILFIGEAPGESEDTIGQPFVGPAGHELHNKILKNALPGHVEIGEDGWTEHWVFDLRLAYTNLVCCIPADEFGKTGEPDDAEIRACSQRLTEYIKIARPRLVVCVGSLSSKWIRGKMRAGLGLSDTMCAEIVHPAAILRAPTAQKTLMRQRAIVALRNAVNFLMQGASDA